MNSIDELNELHWMMSMLQNIEVGLVVINRQNEIQLWNSFMENHSGVLSSDANNKVLFEIFPEIPDDWFKHKVNSVFELRTRALVSGSNAPIYLNLKTTAQLVATLNLCFRIFLSSH
jgi:PAS domain-containing protein